MNFKHKMQYCLGISVTRSVICNPPAERPINALSRVIYP